MNTNDNRRTFIQKMVKAGFSAGLIGLCNCEQFKKPMNIVLIVADDLGINDIGSYGSDISTPNIDKIGKNGIRFTSFYVTASVCTPSRYGLLTGKYQYRAAKEFQEALLVKSSSHENTRLAADELTLADLLKQQGYKTALVGKWHLGHGDIEYGPNNHGFDYFYGFLPGCIDYYEHSYENTPALYLNKKPVNQSGYSTDIFTENAMAFIEENKKGPFFMYLSYNAPHYGRCPDGKYLQSPPEAKDLPAKSVDSRSVYASIIQNLDKGIGQLIDKLNELQLLQDTLVIFISDNGADYDYGGNNKPYKGEKGNLWEGGIRVPCMIQWPGKIKPNQVSDQVVISLDFLPTIMSLTGGPVPPNRIVDGIDIKDCLFTGKKLPERYLYFKTKTQIAVRDNRWKYVEDSDKNYLFDLKNDPNEQINLIEEKVEQARKLKKAYYDFMEHI